MHDKPGYSPGSDSGASFIKRSPPIRIERLVMRHILNFEPLCVPLWATSGKDALDAHPSPVNLVPFRCNHIYQPAFLDFPASDSTESHSTDK